MSGCDTAAIATRIKRMWCYNEAPVEFLYLQYRPCIVPCFMYLVFAHTTHYFKKGGMLSGTHKLCFPPALPEEDASLNEWKHSACVLSLAFADGMLVLAFLCARIPPRVGEVIVSVAFAVDTTIAMWFQPDAFHFLVLVLIPVPFACFCVSGMGFRRAILFPCISMIFVNLLAVVVTRGMCSTTIVGGIVIFPFLCFLYAHSQHKRFRSLFDTQGSLAAEREATQALATMICDAVCWVAQDGDEILRSDKRLNELLGVGTEGCGSVGRRLSEFLPDEEKLRLRSITAAPPCGGEAGAVKLLPSTLRNLHGSLIQADIFVVDTRMEGQKWGFLLGFRVPFPVPLPPNVECIAEEGRYSVGPTHLASPASPREAMERSSNPDTLVSTYLPEPRMHACRREELEQAVVDGSTRLSFSPLECPQTRATMLAALDLVCKHARGGTLICIADAEAFRQVFGNRSGERGGVRPALRSSDEGYMTDRLRGVHVGDERFAAAFQEFTRHTADDRWPADHPDPSARGRPKDGALLLSKGGYSMKCAVKMIGLCPAATWRNMGTKHEAALGCAWAVPGSLVIVKSDRGSLHVLRRQGQDVNVYALEQSSSGLLHAL